MGNQELYVTLTEGSEPAVDFAKMFESGIVETQPETPYVDKMLARFNKQWEETATECIRRAEELEGAAMDLRERADRLRSACDLTAEVRGAVVFEINARNRAASLALVNPQEG